MSDEIRLTEIRVNDAWFRIYINGEDTSYIVSKDNLGDLSPILSKYRLRAAMRVNLDGSDY